MADLTLIFGGAFNAKDHAKKQNSIDAFPESGFLDELARYGLVVDHIRPNEVTRCTTQDKPRKKNGWYLFFPPDLSTGIAAGVFGDWSKSDASHYWCNKSEKDFTHAERAAHEKHVKALQEKARLERKKNHDAAAKKASEIFSKLEYVQDHPYLDLKQCKAHGIKLEKDALVIPIRDVSGNIRSLQRVYPNKDKYMMKGGEKRGNFHMLGSVFTEPTYIAEGYATAATIYEITKKSVVVAFDAGNIKPVIDNIRDAGNSCQLIIAADNDASQAGIKAAEKAAEGQYGIKVIQPQLNGSSGSDFNDLFVAQGELETRKQLLGEPNNTESFIKFSNTTIYKDPTPLDYVVDDFFVAGTTSMIYGAPGICKSFIIQDIGMSVATGRAWHTREVSQGSVFYICGEGHQDLPNRIHAWKTHHGLEKDDVFPFYHTEHEVNLLDPDAVKEITRICLDLIEEKPRLIIIDTLSTNFGGGDENSGDMAEFINGCNTIAREVGAHVSVIHHSGKDDSKGARGSSSAHGNVYSYFNVDKGDEFTRLNTIKQKGGLQLKPLCFDMKLIDLGTAQDSRGRELPITSLVPVLEQDANLGEEATKNILNELANKRKSNQKTRKQLTENQSKFISMLAQIINERKANRPEIKDIFIEQKELRERLINNQFEASNVQRMIKSMADKGFVTFVNDSMLKIEYDEF